MLNGAGFHQPRRPFSNIFKVHAVFSGMGVFAGIILGDEGSGRPSPRGNAADRAFPSWPTLAVEPNEKGIRGLPADPDVDDRCHLERKLQRNPRQRQAVLSGSQGNVTLCLLRRGR